MTQSPFDKVNHYKVIAMKITLEEFLREVFKSKRLLIISLLISLTLGLSYTFLNKRSFEVTIKLIPRSSDSGGLDMSGLGGLASLAGINVGSSQKSDDIPAAIYPEILSSTPYLLEVMKLDVLTEAGTSKSFNQFYFEDYKTLPLNKIKKYTIDLPSILLNSSNDQPSPIYPKDSLSFTPKEYEVIQYLRSKLSLNVSKQDGIVSLSFDSFDPFVSRDLADNAMNSLKARIKEYKLEKIKSEMNFLDSLNDVKRWQYENAQETLAKFKDENSNLTTSRSRIEEDRLEKEFDLAYELLSEVSKEFERVKISSKKIEPSFMILQPSVLPLEQVGSGRIMTIILISFASLIFVLILITVKLVVKKYIGFYKTGEAK